VVWQKEGTFRSKKKKGHRRGHDDHPEEKKGLVDQEGGGCGPWWRFGFKGNEKGGDTILVTAEASSADLQVNETREKGRGPIFLWQQGVRGATPLLSHCWFQRRDKNQEIGQKATA